MKSFLKIFGFIAIISLVTVSCNDTFERLDPSSPDLELKVSSLNTSVTVSPSQKVGFPVTFSNATGEVSYKWIQDRNILSTDKNFMYSNANTGTYTIMMYAQDSAGKYTNKTITIIVK